MWNQSSQFIVKNPLDICDDVNTDTVNPDFPNMSPWRP